MSIARYMSMAVDSSVRPAPLSGLGDTACRGPGGNGPGAGACPAPQPGRGPGGSGLRPTRASGGSRCAAISPRRWRAYASVAAFLVRTGERQSPLGQGLRVLQAASQQMRLPPGGDPERLKACHHCASVPSPAPEQRHGVGDAPAQGHRPPPRPQPSRGKRSGSPRPDRGSRPVRAGGGPWAGRLGGGTADRAPKRPHEARGARPPRPAGALLHRGHGPRERAQLGMAQGEVGREARRAGRPGRSAHGAAHPSRNATVCPKQAIARPIVTLALVGQAKVEVRQRVQDDILAGRGQRRARWAAAMAWS